MTWSGRPKYALSVCQSLSGTEEAADRCQRIKGSDTLEISYASSEITFEIMKSHTQKKSEITLFENENRKTPYISVTYGRIE